MSKRRAKPVGSGARLTAVASTPRSEAEAKATTRVRYSGVFPEPVDGKVPYASLRPELADLDDAAIVELMRSSRAWQEVMVPLCLAIDERRRRRAKTPPLYDSETLEAVLLFGRVCGLKTYKEIRDRLAGDRGGKIRAQLGLDRPCSVPGQKVVKLRRGIPSEATVSRHRRKHFPEEQRLGVYLELEKRFRDEHLATDGLRREARNLDMDGTAILTHYTAPIYDGRKSRRKDGVRKLVNDGLSPRGYRKISAPTAGFMPKGAGLQWWGHGWKLVSVVTQTGVPLAWELVAADVSENATAVRILRDQMPDVIDRLGTRVTRILSADGAFTGSDVREACHELGIHENIHHVSHGKSDSTLKNVETNDARKIPIRGYPNWYSNGHRELKCQCGKGRVVKRSTLSPDGKSVPRIEGQCPTCKSVTITAGDWYLAENPTEWRRVGPFDKFQEPDWLFGNPLTFHDAVAAEYGSKRFAHNEGFHGVLASRFGLTDEKRWFRRRNQAAIECAMTFSILHAVALEWRRRGDVARPVESAKAPPGALAA